MGPAGQVTANDTLTASRAFARRQEAGLRFQPQQQSQGETNIFIADWVDE
jgi:hypothetical protein